MRSYVYSDIVIVWPIRSCVSLIIDSFIYCQLSLIYIFLDEQFFIINWGRWFSALSDFFPGSVMARIILYSVYI